MDDSRFKPFFKDIRSRKIPKNVSKVKIDKRFQNMFRKQQFKKNSRYDERGRKLTLTPSENLKNLYNVTDSSDDDDKDSLSANECERTVPQKFSRKSGNENNSEFEKSSKETMSYVPHISKSKSNIKTKGLERILHGKEKNESYVIDDSLSSQTKLNDPASIYLVSKEEKIVTSSDRDSCDDKELEEELKSKDAYSQSKMKKKVTKKSTIGRFSPSDEQPKQKLVLENNESDESSSGDDNESSSSEGTQGDNITKNDSSEDDESADSESEDSEDIQEDNFTKNDAEFDHRWEELQEDAPDTQDITKRLAVCNMDWDRIRADDIFAVFNSFKPPDGIVHSVKIYPSEFGLKRMEEEKLKGPAELVEEILDPNEEEEEVQNKKGQKYHREKLRQYQINRLKYYYAVVECDTAETANKLYDELNGMEYESSSIRFDLRFIPDDLTFDHEPTSVADKIPDSTDYKPRLFVTTALQQVKVNLTWDETDPRRRETLQKAFTEPESLEKDLKDYLASTSGDSEDDGEEELDNDGMKLSTKERIEKFRALLQSLEEKKKQEDEKVDMEITWEPGLKEKTEKMVQQKLDNPNTPFEKMLKKQKEDRKSKKNKNSVDSKPKDAIISSEEENSDISSDENISQNQTEQKLDALYLMTDSRKKVENTGESHKISRKKKKKKVEQTEKAELKYDVFDPRFSAVYTSHEYNIDPSDPHFKKTEGALAIIQEKQKRLQAEKYKFTEKNKNKRMKYV